MKKDIDIAPVENVFLAVTQEYNETFIGNDYYVYLINQKEQDLEMVLVLSLGSDGEVKTSQMRHKIEKLPANSFAKVELMQEEVLGLNNVFKVSFFEENRMFEKNFTLKKGALKEGNLRRIKILDKRGVLIK